MGKRIAFMGAGGVGAYVGGHLARAGEDVTLIDPWPEHIETMKHNGLNLSGTQGEHTVRVNACIFTKCKACTKRRSILPLSAPSLTIPSGRRR